MNVRPGRDVELWWRTFGGHHKHRWKKRKKEGGGRGPFDAFGLRNSAWIYVDRTWTERGRHRSDAMSAAAL